MRQKRRIVLSQRKRRTPLLSMGMFFFLASHLLSFIISSWQQHSSSTTTTTTTTAVLAFWVPATTRSWRQKQQQHVQTWTTWTVASAATTTTLQDSADSDVIVRDCTFAELGQVADIIIASFYSNATSPWKQMYRLGELSRVQQGFPHNEPEKHRMLVALLKSSNSSSNNGNSLLKQQKHVVAGFCDIDARKPNQPSFAFNPRPYLSDLCIHPDFRRMGIAQTLVEFCERFCVNDLQKNELFIRVDRSNIPALGMYQKMGYQRIHNHPDDIARSKDIILLKKSLSSPPSEDSGSELMQQNLNVQNI